MTATITTPGIKLDMTVSGTTATDFSFAFAGSIHSFTVNVPRKLHEGSKQVVRGKASGCGVTEEEIERKYYENFVTDSEQDEFYEVLLDTFQQIKREKRLSDDEFVELLCAFVQSIPYDEEKLKAQKKGPQHHNFAAETIANGAGMCADKSLLLCGLLAKAGYGACLMCFYDDHHALAAVAVPHGTGYNRGKYAIIETTSKDYQIGERPKRLKGKCTPYPIGNGSKVYHLERSKELKKRLEKTVREIDISKERINEQTERALALDAECTKRIDTIVSLDKKISSNRYSASEVSEMKAMQKRLSTNLKEMVLRLEDEKEKLNTASEYHNSAVQLLKKLRGRAVDSRTNEKVISKGESLLIQAREALA